MTVRDIFAAAYEALDAGRAMVRATHRQFHFAERRGPGPAMVRWQQEQGARPAAPAPKVEVLDGSETYFLSDDDIAAIDAVRPMLALARFSKRSGVRNAVYADIGRYLMRLRADRDKSHFADLVKEQCGLSVRRAYELIAIARGTKGLKTLRAEKTASMRKTRRKQRVSRKNKAPKGPQTAAFRALVA
jgi:hypothetical protein